MNIFQKSWCSILGVLLVFFLQGSCDLVVEMHKAVGDSLDLIADYPKEDLEVLWKYKDTEIAEYDKNKIQTLKSQFHERLKINEDNISITFKDLKLQDSGTFSIVARTNSTQHQTKFINLHVHDLIRDVQIESSDSWLASKNMCMFHLRCQASGDPNPSYSWSNNTVNTGPNLNISLRPAESATLNCTVNNTISVKFKTKTVECTEPSGTVSGNAGFPQMYLLIAVGVSIVVIVIFSGTVAACFRWRKQTGQGESEGGITVYEDVNTDGIAKKQPGSVVNGMSIYETVDDMKVTQNLPQTLYDKINYQRHPAVSANTSSPYQEVL